MSDSRSDPALRHRFFLPPTIRVPVKIRGMPRTFCERNRPGLTIGDINRLRPPIIVRDLAIQICSVPDPIFDLITNACTGSESPDRYSARGVREYLTGSGRTGPCRLSRFLSDCCQELHASTLKGNKKYKKDTPLRRHLKRSRNRNPYGLRTNMYWQASDKAHRSRPPNGVQNPTGVKKMMTDKKY